MSQLIPTNIEATKFAESFVLYGDKSKAFRAAFPKSKASKKAINEKAVLTFKTTKVSQRIQDLHKSINDKADANALFTAEQALIELNENRALAEGLEMPAAMNGATMGKAKIAGLLIDKVESKDVTPPEININLPDGF